MEAENTSGQGANAPVPPEIDRWNWGAFFLNWIWGIGNNTLIALLTLVPCAGFVMPFVLGAKGSAWAWRNRKWQSVAEFQRAQRTWTLASVVVVALGVAIAIGAVFAATAALKSSEAYRVAQARVVNDPQLTAALGTPIDTGLVRGSISATPSDGKAHISFPVEGPKGEGTVYVDAVKDMGRWKILRLQVEVQGKPDRLILEGPAEGMADDDDDDS
jgi:hypothetical protein